MATTQGAVLSLVWTGNALCAQIGAPGAAELLFLAFAAGDAPEALQTKRSMAKLLAAACAAGYPVVVTHGDSDPAIAGTEIPGSDICPSRAVLDDFFTVSGNALADDVVVEFDGPAAVVTVTPDLVRPSWVLVARLPGVLPAERHLVRLRSPSTGWSSGAVPVEVWAAPPERVRRLYTGAPKEAPYAIGFFACPAIRTNAGALVADPVIADRPAFHAAVARSLDNLLRSAEDVLRANNLEAAVQFVCVHDETRALVDAFALVQEDSTNMIEARRDLFRGFADDYLVAADVGFALSGSATHTRSTAWFTTDDAGRPGVGFTYDGAAFSHRRFASVPGTVALSTTAGGLTALHEFGHAASDFNNGMVDDLYVDGLRPGLQVNKKARALATDPVPPNFAAYDFTEFASDAARDGLGYPATWTSYHCELLDPARPNMMDNFWFADDPRLCRLDRLTRAWLADRLAAKASR